MLFFGSFEDFRFLKKNPENYGVFDRKLRGMSMIKKHQKLLKRKLRGRKLRGHGVYLLKINS